MNEKYDKLSIDVLELPIRAHNVLWFNDCQTVGAVKKLTVTELSELHGIGVTTLAKTIAQLNYHDITLNP